MSHPAAEQFDRVAGSYATSPVHAQGPDLEWLVEALQPAPDWQALDLGTGAGHAAMAVAPHLAQVTAVDLAEAMLAVARRLAVGRNIENIVFQSADVQALPFADHTFDAAFTRYSAHHWDDPAGALQEAARVMRPGAPLVLIDTISPGEAALDTFSNGLEMLRDPSHVRNARVVEWRTALQEAGFAVESVREWPIVLHTNEWLARAGAQSWRADACRQLLQDASLRARAVFAIAEDGSHFNLHCALLLARRG